MKKIFPLPVRLTSYACISPIFIAAPSGAAFFFFRYKKGSFAGIGVQNDERSCFPVEIRNKDSPVVYICSPYSGDVERNTKMARRYSRYAIDNGYTPITPHLWLPGILSEETERELAISLDLRLLDLVSELWVCGDTVSEGMKREIDHAAEAGIPVRIFEEEKFHVRD
ncbi:MAG: hypothetical protein J6W82_07715 [Bacteroidales bacterium]|nr:hypothetical protein [Bacteroidales bacterium]